MPAPDYSALAIELAEPDLFGLSDEAAAAKLTSDRVSLPSAPVPIADVESLAFRRGVIGRLYAGAESAEAGLRSACKAAIALFDSRLTEVHMDDPATVALLDALQAGGIVSSDDRAAMEALAERSISRAESIPGWGILATSADVAHARSL